MSRIRGQDGQVHTNTHPHLRFKKLGNTHTFTHAHSKQGLPVKVRQG